jgi:TolA-binding protein
MHDADPVRSSGWSVALQVLVSIVIAFVLIAGPQVETLWGRVRERLVELNKPRPAAERPPAVERSPAETKRPQAPQPAVTVAPQKAPAPSAAPVASQTAPVQPVPPAQVQPKPKASPAGPATRERPKPVVVARRPYAPVLTEPKSDPRPAFAALMQEGYELYRSGWYGPAMGRFKAATQIMPSSVPAYLWMGRSGLKAGRTAEARRALEQVIVLAPGSEAAREARTLLGTSE